jgi:hypothetical protein
MKAGVLALLGLAGCDLVFTVHETCSTADCLTVLAKNEGGASEIAVAGNDVLWTIELAPGAVRTCAVDACTPRTLADGEDRPHSLRAMGANAVWAAGNNIRCIARDATNPAAILVKHDPDTGRFVSIHNVDQYVYSASTHGLWRCAIPNACRPCTDESSMSEYLYGSLTSDAQDMLWGDDATQLYGIDLGQGGISHLYAVAGVQALAASTSVFAIAGDGPQLLTWPPGAPNDSAPTAIDTGGTPAALAIDRDQLFVGLAEGRIVQIEVSPAIGTPKLVVDGLTSIQHMAVTPDRVYVVAGDTIGYIPRP